MTPGAIVRNDTEPSGFVRDATSLFHSPKSNTVVAPCLLHGDLAERRRSCSCAASLPASRGVGRHRQQLALGRELLEERLRARRDLGIRLGPAVEQHLEQLAPEAGRGSASPGRRSSGSPRRRRAPAATSCRCGSRSCRRRGARPVTPYFVSTIRPMPYVASLPIATCGARRASSASLRDVRACRSAACPRRAPSART